MTDTRAQTLKVVHRNRAVANSIVWFGDSITFNGGRNAATPMAYQANGFWCWAQFLLGHQFSFLANLGVSGQQTDQMVPRVNDVVSLRPGFVHILAGTNDVNKGIDISHTIANLDYMLGVFEGAGIRVILGTIPPQNTTTATGAMQLRRLNQWIRNQGRARRNIIVVDYNAALTSPSSGGYAGSGFLLLTNDGTHPNPLGAYIMGTALANAVRAAGIAGVSDLFADEQDVTNALLYAQFQTGGTSSAPTGWNASTPTNSGTVAWSKVTRTDLPTQSPVVRQWQRIVLTPTSAGQATTVTVTNANPRAASWMVGDTIVGSMAVRVTSCDQAPATYTQAGVTLGIRCLNSGGAVIAQADDLYWSPGASAYPNHTLDNRQGVFRTPPLVIPAGTTNLSLVLTIGGGCTVDMDQAGLENVSRYALTG